MNRWVRGDPDLRISRLYWKRVPRRQDVERDPRVPLILRVPRDPRVAVLDPDGFLLAEYRDPIYLGLPWRGPTPQRMPWPGPHVDRRWSVWKNPGSPPGTPGSL